MARVNAGVKRTNQEHSTVPRAYTQFRAMHAQPVGRAHCAVTKARGWRGEVGRYAICCATLST